jgi:hypothetical protein
MSARNGASPFKNPLLGSLLLQRSKIVGRASGAGQRLKIHPAALGEGKGPLEHDEVQLVV